MKVCPNPTKTVALHHSYKEYSTRMKLLLVIFISILGISKGDEYHPRGERLKRSLAQDEGVEYWQSKGQAGLDSAKSVFASINQERAKNIIIFVGDGMSLPTLTASRIYKAQKASNFDGSVMGEESTLFFETFPHVGLSKTYSADHQTPDSASTASAMFSGIKTNSGTLGFDNKIEHGDVDSISKATEVETIMSLAQEAGKATGFVTTTRITHATPASLYAHSADRDWECFRDLEKDGVNGKVHEIAWQLMNQRPGNMTKVVMGGGWKEMQPESIQRDDYSDDYWDHKCYTESDDFTEDFLDESDNNAVAFNKTDLDNIDVTKVDRILGLFSPTHTIFDHERRARKIQGLEDAPSLVDMTKKAIERLQINDGNGFFLMVEGGRIDHAHHSTFVNTAMDETTVFDEAIETAFNMTSAKDTLIIVTADHGHTMEMSGYPLRGADIRGYHDGGAEDGLPYSILSYANGNGFMDHVNDYENKNWTRKDIRTMDYKDFYYRSPTTLVRDSETHSGADVGIFSSGPFAHFFHGVHEQTHIFYVMAYSGCLGKFSNEPHCQSHQDSTTTSTTPPNVGSRNEAFSLVMVLFAVFLNL